LAAELAVDGTGDGTGTDVRGDILARVLRWPAAQRAPLLADVAAACARAAAAGGPPPPPCPAAPPPPPDPPCAPGIVASLLLRHGVLHPGQAVFLPAGGLHAYLRGTGIELLANSDNVVRAGLTGKHIDVPELLKLTDPAAEVPLIAPRDLGHGIAA